MDKKNKNNRISLDDIKAHRREVTLTADASRTFLRGAGIIDKKGNLAKPYKEINKLSYRSR
ncbi:hypothetical protein [Parabacteroides sp. Marseille-P3160]|uniref:hypothetical protein n=1 Tax=Parabacteroides sp. Marseille-P3160 TaxID=1917887 RepID=UPI0009B9B104|nr:hypothetical protein [Parabacteroides sp. Marseille-P3160]